MVLARAQSRLRVKTVHFGGGTPTIMTARDFTRLMHLLRDRLELADSAEVAIEIDPRTLTPEMLEALDRSGITRASLGVQSFDPVVQQSINRIQSIERTAETGYRARLRAHASIRSPRRSPCVRTVWRCSAMRTFPASRSTSA
jgi:oxygen-independent coproporphyrinogen-3 oxidase